MLQLKRSAAVAAVAAVAVLAGSGVAAAASQDLRNADQQAPASAQDAALAAEAARPAEHRGGRLAVQDLRNPDRQAPGAPATDGTVGDTLPAETVGTEVIQVSARGFDWGDAGIGAAGGLAILILAGSAAILFTHRRRGVRVRATAG